MINIIWCDIGQVALIDSVYTVKLVTRGHLSGCLNCIFCEPKCNLTLNCTCDEGHLSCRDTY